MEEAEETEEYGSEKDMGAVDCAEEESVAEMDGASEKIEEVGGYQRVDEKEVVEE